MSKQVSDNILIKHKHINCVCAMVFVFVYFSAYSSIIAQNIPTQIVPFEELLEREANLRPELQNKHPRLFFTVEDLAKLREKARGSDRNIWLDVLKEVESFRSKVPNLSDEDFYESGLAELKKGSMTQYSLAFRISQTSFAYDILFDKLSKDEKTLIKEKPIKQSHLMYEYFKYKSNKKYTYSQNHTWIPMGGLAVAAYVLVDEVPEAKNGQNFHGRFLIARC